jgi:hypothetical protein
MEEQKRNVKKSVALVTTLIEKKAIVKRAKNSKNFDSLVLLSLIKIQVN